MSTVVVAQAVSKGGKCASCGRHIRRGDPVYKIDTGERGGTTSGGNGYGAWLGECCLPDVDAEPA